MLQKLYIQVSVDRFLSKTVKRCSVFHNKIRIHNSSPSGSRNVRFPKYLMHLSTLDLSNYTSHRDETDTVGFLLVLMDEQNYDFGSYFVGLVL